MILTYLTVDSRVLLDVLTHGNESHGYSLKYDSTRKVDSRTSYELTFTRAILRDVWTCCWSDHLPDLHSDGTNSHSLVLPRSVFFALSRHRKAPPMVGLSCIDLK